ncbi:hypothetical protein Poli38472_005213 [Pythium oligandrum]|uniref:Uncharacterized protein n=1 Tax=Pythium oligandrum TaxID=41045 RepID=A0A8K1FGC1_PYTOL|nr:hypothetical protein Poli38472_005213 [Pythium oligandrum]|eukprot:TMW62595.1 hypothetical protein Poli38472_005213 [Pythium oligandrum]
MLVKRCVHAANDAVCGQDTTNETPSLLSNGFLADSPMMALSSSILREQIFSYLAFPSLVPHGLDLPAFDAQLTSLRAVCRQWRDVAAALRDFYVSQTVRLELKHHDQRLMAQTQAEQAGLKKDVEQLEIVMGAMRHAPFDFLSWRKKTEYQPYLNRYRIVFVEEEEEPEEVPIEWSVLFSGLVHLRRLDLTLTAAVEVTEILRVTASASPHLEALLLPLKDMVPDDGSSFLQELGDALAIWYEATGGLRHLRIPSLAEGEREELLRLVIAFCPKIEFLQTYTPVRDGNIDDWPIGIRLFDVSIDTWRAFCDQCTCLRELDWSMVPPLPECVEVFASRTWPLLTELRIRFDGAQNWLPRFVRSEIRCIFQSVPMLRVLEIVIPSIDGALDEEFGCDDVLADLTTYCPLLEVLRLRFSYGFVIEYPTIVGWDLLLKMPKLRCLDIGALNDEGSSYLVDMLRSTPLNLRRRVDLHIRGTKYTPISSMLRYLDGQDSERIANLQLCLRLEWVENRDGFPHAPVNPLIKFTELDGLLARIKQRHGKSVKRLHVLVNKMLHPGLGEAAVFLGCEIWINHVEPGQQDKCRFESKLYVRRPVRSSRC